MDNVALTLKGGWKKENTEIVLLFVISAFFVYFTPPALSRIYFFLVLLLAFRSSKPYFWIAFIFILMNEPAGFFAGSTSDDIQRVPVFSFGKGASFSVFDLFLFGYSVKAFLKPRNVVFYKTGVDVLLYFAVILFFFSLTLGMSIVSFVALFRSFVLPFAFFLLVGRLIRNTFEFESMMKLLLPFMLLAIVGQVHAIYFGKYLTTYFKEGADTIAATGLALSETKEGVARAFDSGVLTILAFIYGGFYLIWRPQGFSRIWLVLVMYIGFIICFSSATRGIFLTFSIILLSLFYFLSKSSLLRAKDITSVVLVVAVALIGFSLLKTDSVLSVQLNSASDRISTLGIFIGEKDRSTYEGSNARQDIRIPAMMKNIKESPLIGYGFSDKAREYSDGHVGFHNMAIEGGILEVAVFLYFIFMTIFRVRRISSGFRLGNKKNALRFLAYTLLALMVVHGTSSQYFGYVLGFQSYHRWYMLALVFCGVNLYYYQLQHELIVFDKNKTNENNHPMRRNGYKAS
jgi:hypothetical protein